MPKVFKLGITSNNNKKINYVESIEVVANKGIVGDRHFKEFNDPYCQLSLIESENIDYYNSKYGLNIFKCLHQISSYFNIFFINDSSSINIFTLY